MLPKIINSLGLFLDIIGACFVAWEVVHKYKGEIYLLKNIPTKNIQSSLKPTAEYHPDYKKYEVDKYYKMRFGLFLLIIGFCLQIASNFIYSGPNNETAKNTTPTNIPTIPRVLAVDNSMHIPKIPTNPKQTKQNTADQ